MSTRPQCERVVSSNSAETAYGTAIADGSLTEMFSLVDNVLPDRSQDIVDDTDLLKGHEFREDANAYEVLFDNINIPMNNVPASAEFLAWLFASALGDVTSTEISASGDFDHEIKLMDICADGAQLPSRTLGLLWSGSSTVNTKYKGCVVNTLTLRITDRGRVTVDVQFITDGDEASGSGISVPASFVTTSYYFGKDTDYKEDDFDTPGGLASLGTVLAGFEMTINNNLLVDEAKTVNFQTQGLLPKLEYGDREISCTVTLQGDETSQPYVDAEAQTMKIIQTELLGPTLSGGNDADCIILFPKCLWNVTTRQFDGSTRTYTLNHNLFFDSTEASPITINVTTRQTAVV